MPIVKGKARSRPGTAIYFGAHIGLRVTELWRRKQERENGKAKSDREPDQPEPKPRGDS